MGKTKRERLQERRDKLDAQLDDLYDLMDKMVVGRAQSYTIGSRSITFRTIAEVQEAIDRTEAKIDDIDARLAGHRRYACAVIPRDW